jgi:hypothetical protein
MATKKKIRFFIQTKLMLYNSFEEDLVKKKKEGFVLLVLCLHLKGICTGPDTIYSSFINTELLMILLPSWPFIIFAFFFISTLSLFSSCSSTFDRKMKLSLLFTSISTIFYIASASQLDLGHELVKRDHGVPYASLPNTNCAVPSTCSSISGTPNCRCSDTITVCLNEARNFCWGSISLNSTSCPSVPESCSSVFTGNNPTCLCNDKNVLCVDQKNNYCYGAINAGAVTLQPIPNANPSSAVPSGATPSAGASGNPNMSVIGAPTNVAAATPTQASGSDRLTVTSMLTLGCALAAYIAIH